MRSSLRWVLLAACLPVVAALLTACSALRPPRPEELAAEAEALAVLDRLRASNRGLQQFKGVGRIRLTGGAAPAINQRAAWAGAVPDRLSVAVLAAGRPVLKFATDGRHTYLADLRPPKPSRHKVRASDPQLDKLIAVPVRASEMVELLAGRAPICAHSAARLESGGDGGWVLVLETWRRVAQRIYLDGERSAVRALELFDRDGQLRYRVDFGRLQPAGDYRIPASIEVSGAGNGRLRIEIEQYFPDAALDPAAFVLDEPDRDPPPAAN